MKSIQDTIPGRLAESPREQSLLLFQVFTQEPKTSHPSCLRSRSTALGVRASLSRLQRLRRGSGWAGGRACLPPSWWAEGLGLSRGSPDIPPTPQGHSHRPCSAELPRAHGRVLRSPGGAWVSRAAFYTDAAPTPDRYPAHPSLSLDSHSGCAWAAVLPCPQGRFSRPPRGAGDRDRRGEQQGWRCLPTAAQPRPGGRRGTGDTRKAWRLVGARPLLPQGRVGIIQKWDLPGGEPQPERGGAGGCVVRGGVTTPQGLPPHQGRSFPGAGPCRGIS